MKKIMLAVLIVVCLVWLTQAAAFAAIGSSSEWEATGFNNGRRMVRDSVGFYHAFWHSQANPNAAPNGGNCQIYYSYTLVPAMEPPSMDAAGAWAPPIPMTINLGNRDNRYPAVAIEYEVWDGNWLNVNRIHVVWQGMTGAGNRYEIFYASIPVANPPVPPAPWGAARNLSVSPMDSLVPAIAINRYGPGLGNQHLHVVWQEEDVTNAVGGPQEDAWFSEIAYIRSTDSGLTWFGPQGNMLPLYPWDNLTGSGKNSQMPSIACILDQHTGVPHRFGIGEFGYNSDDVHVTFNEDINPNGGINVFYLRSTNDGLSWNPRVNISTVTGGGAAAFDAYSNIAVDMLDNPHIVFMRGVQMVKREPMRTVPANNYLPGINSLSWWSFPGPEIGMYNTRHDKILYAYNNGAAWTSIGWSDQNDKEFPTVALDRQQGLTVNWQEYIVNQNDYEIMRVYNINLVPPAFPVPLQVYQGWIAPVNDSRDPQNDDLFPNLAHKKAAMFLSPFERGLFMMTGFDEVWTKVFNHNPFASPKNVMQEGNMQWGP